jgi:hypothetical protein
MQGGRKIIELIEGGKGDVAFHLGVSPPSFHPRYFRRYERTKEKAVKFNHTVWQLIGGEQQNASTENHSFYSSSVLLASHPRHQREGGRGGRACAKNRDVGRDVKKEEAE